MSYFPLFLDLSTRKCLVLGEGNIAKHKAKQLTNFGGKVTRLSGIEELSSLNQFDIVICAMRDRDFNHSIARYCRANKILCNVVDDIAYCDFIFPTICQNDCLIGAFSTGGNAPIVAQYLRDKCAVYLTKELATFTRYLGKIRGRVKDTIPYHERKNIYVSLLELFFEGKVSTYQEIENTVKELADETHTPTPSNRENATASKGNSSEC